MNIRQIITGLRRMRKLPAEIDRAAQDIHNHPQDPGFAAMLNRNTATLNASTEALERMAGNLPGARQRDPVTGRFLKRDE